MNYMMRDQSWASAGSTIASLMFFWAIIDKFIPSTVKSSLARHASKLTAFFNPYIHVTVPEFTGEFSRRNEAFTAVGAYLTSNSSHQAKNLNAEITKPSQKLSLTIGTHEEVVDVYNGIKIWWHSGKMAKTNQLPFSWYPDRDEKRWYRLSCHARHRKLVTEVYLPHVIDEGKAIKAKGRRKRLYTNNVDSERHARLWSSVVFDHPATFGTLAMDQDKKKEVMDDLAAFKERKEYYEKIGRAWKRGYLLYGPPGTGKSSMIAAMANFLDYDVYDLELTAVKDNSELRRLLFDTASKSIIVIEDIDCSLNLAGKRSAKRCNDEETDTPLNGKETKQGSKVTLSGLLNFIDGLWSSCGGERIIVFTTNHIEKLDPALIRRGRMDMHIELAYCSFEGYKVLAENYLGVESHALFERIEELIGEVFITPADVAENLMLKSGDVDVEACLQRFIDVLRLVKTRMEEVSKEEILTDENEENRESEENEEGVNNESEESI